MRIMNDAARDFLNTDLQFVKGIGPVIAARFDELLGGRRVLDFLLHRPHYVRPREVADSVTNATPGDHLTILVDVISHKPGGTFRSGRRAPAQVVTKDRFGATLTLQFFSSSYLDYWLAKLPIGEQRIVSGKLEFNGKSAIINHPDFIEKPDDADKVPTHQVIYPTSAGLSQKLMATARDQIFEKLRAMYDDSRVTEFLQNLEQMHFATSNDTLEPSSDVMMHLASAELLAHQIAIAFTRQKRKRGIAGQAINGDGSLREKLRALLPFQLTAAQENTIAEIYADQAKPEPMMRLVQGDVGSGKTIVALLAMLNAAEMKTQSVLMAPTDTLAQQHYAKIKPFCDSLGVVCELLTGRDKGKARNEKLISIRSGRARIIIGTHAVFQDDVEYKNLSLVIVDEQHRFGVEQRAKLAAKGANPDLLALSATPIPRTLSMTIYGDMDISIINQKPAGRMPIKTSALSHAKIRALCGRIKGQIDDGAKVFWVCPLVADAENNDTANATARHEYLQKLFGDSVGLVHGQMDKKERDAVMARFADAADPMKILVATSVIEVGIDVPSATIMVIENAERFGLSALHQLRGRVGRNSQQSFCILLHGDHMTEDGQKRLAVLTETDDGFVIAEQDLMMRGAGVLLGTKQSGWTSYYFTDYREHRDLFKLAQKSAMELAETDPRLISPDGGFARDLMHIFGRETKIVG